MNKKLLKLLIKKIWIKNAQEKINIVLLDSLKAMIDLLSAMVLKY